MLSEFYLSILFLDILNYVCTVIKCILYVYMYIYIYISVCVCPKPYQTRTYLGGVWRVVWAGLGCTTMGCVILYDNML